MRVTRAAQRAQQDGEEERVEAAEVNERILKDIEPNTTPAAPTDEPLPAKTPAKTPLGKGKGKGKKSAKGRKANIKGDELAQFVEEADRQAAASPVDEAAEQEPAQDPTDDATQATDDGQQRIVPQTPAIRLTRRQLAKLEEEEALRKSQRAPSPQPEQMVADVADKGVEEAEVALEVKTNVSGERKTLAPRDDHAEVEPQTAQKPTKRTQRHETQREEERREETITENVAAQSKAPEAPVEAAGIVVEAERTAVVEQAKSIKPEPTAKSVRLTRRQQAKVEEELKQAQIESQTPRFEPTEEEVLDEIIMEAQAEAEAAARQEEVISKGAVHGGTSKTENISLAAATVPSRRQGGVTTDLQKDSTQLASEAIEKETTPEARPTEIKTETSKAIVAEDMALELRPATPTEAEFETDFNIQVDNAVPKEVVPSFETIPEAEPKMLHAEKPFEGIAPTPTRSQGSIRRTSRSPSKSPMRLEESISAIDRLEEDLESIGKAIPDLDHSDEERSPKELSSGKVSEISAVRGKTPSKTPARTPAKASTRTPAKVETKTPGRTPTTAPIPTRASGAAARVSIAPKPPVVKKEAVPMRISRVPSAAPKSVKPTTTLLARASSVRTAPTRDIRKPSTDTNDYLASKRRPISLSFPTPPPPPKGRAPTKSTFQLSSDSVAAKLKVQKEERLKREAQSIVAPKQRPISMPPPPKSTKPPTVPSFQLPGEATAAKLKAQKEERLKRMEEAGGAVKPASRPISMPPPPKSMKQLTKPNFQLPGEATAVRLKAQKEERLKRMEEAEMAKKAAAAAPVRKPIAHRPRESLLVKDAPGVSIPPPHSDVAQRTGPLASKRSSSIIGISASRSTSTSSANRKSVLLAGGGKSGITPVDAAALKVKGKQVFDRDRMDKETIEHERRQKEEAAKRARAEAAERGRIASREWAERQKRKLMGQ